MKMAMGCIKLRHKTIKSSIFPKMSGVTLSAHGAPAIPGVVGSVGVYVNLVITIGYRKPRNYDRVSRNYDRLEGASKCARRAPESQGRHSGHLCSVSGAAGEIF